MKCVTHVGHSIAFFHSLTLWFWPLPFDLMLIGGRRLVMDYPCDEFGDFSFSRFGFITRTDRRNHRITDAAKRFTPATAVGVSNKRKIVCVEFNVDEIWSRHEGSSSSVSKILFASPILHLASSEQRCWSGGRGILTELSLCYSIV